MIFYLQWYFYFVDGVRPQLRRMITLLVLLSSSLVVIHGNIVLSVSGIAKDFTLPAYNALPWAFQELTQSSSPNITGIPLIPIYETYGDYNPCDATLTPGDMEAMLEAWRQEHQARINKTGTKYITKIENAIMIACNGYCGI